MSRIIKLIYYKPTYECNLRCKYCYLGKNRQKQTLTEWTYLKEGTRRLVDKFKEADCLLRSVIYHGAETTTIPAKVLAETCNIFHEIVPSDFYKQAVQTNGTLVTPEYIAEFEEYVNENVRFNFSFSIDGPNDLTDASRNKGTYEKAMRHAVYLRKRGYNVNMYGVITSAHMDRLQELGEWIDEMNSLRIKWSYQLAAGEYGLTDEQQVRLAHWMYDNGLIDRLNVIGPDKCTARGNDCANLHINADGKFFACDRNRDLIIPLFNSWFDRSLDEMIAKRSGAFRDVPTSPQCARCPIRSVCNSGCPAFRAKNGRSVDCALKRELYAIASKRMNVPMSKIIRLFATESGYTRWRGPAPTVGDIKRQNAR